MCVPHLTQSALDLINRFKRQCNKYRNKAQSQKGELRRLYKQNADYKAEIERLKKSLDNMTDALVKTDEACRKAEAEAIKELVKRLKDRVVKKYKYTDVRIFNELDNLVKEMVGENDG